MDIADLSHWQTVTDWAALREASPIIILKATNSGSVDPKFRENQRQARAHHFEAIVYYDYLTKNADPAASARFFMETVGPLAPNDGLCCDLEEGDGDQSGRLDTWNATVPGDTELDYSGLSFWQTHLGNAHSAFHRWVAAYRPRDPHAPLETLWQNTDAHQFPGVSAPCDASIFNGTVDQFKAALGLGGNPPPVPPTPGGWLMALTDKQQQELYDWTRETNLRVKDLDEKVAPWVAHILGWVRAIGKFLKVPHADAVANDPTTPPNDPTGPA